MKHIRCLTRGFYVWLAAIFSIILIDKARPDAYQDALALAGVSRGITQSRSSVKSAAQGQLLPTQSVNTTGMSWVDQASALRFDAVDIARGGENPIIAGIAGGKVFSFEGGAWLDITSNINVPLSKISIAADRTIWVLDQKGASWRRLAGQTVWTQFAGDFMTISVGNKNEVWSVAKGNAICRKVDGQIADPSVDWFNRWFQLPDIKAVDVSCGGDASVWLVNIDGIELYKFNRSSWSWERIVRSSDVGIGSAYRLKVADEYNILLLNQKNEVWRLTPGARGDAKNHWQKIASYQFFDASIGIDGTIVGVDFNRQFIVLNPADDQGVRAQELLAARGDLVMTNQVGRLISRWDGRRVWTHAFSPFDAQGTNPAPENHLEVLAGVSDPLLDYRQDQGSFFKLTDPANTRANRPLKYGDTVEIWSLYACPGDPKKSGGLGGEWKWWLYDKHHKWGESWRNVVVSLMRYQHTYDGNQLFAIRSPYGRTGEVYSNDAIELVSLAAHAQNRPLFIHPWSTLGGGSYELMAHSGDLATAAHGGSFSAFGPFDQSGQQIFSFKMVKEGDVPAPAINAYRRALGLDVSDDSLEGVDKSDLLLDTSAGIAMLTTLQNETSYPLKTNIIGVLPPRESKNSVNQSMVKPFTFEGTGEGPEYDFGRDSIWECPPMFSRSIAWITMAVETPGSMSFVFLAKGTDDGNIQILFGDKVAPDARFRIHIGMQDNTKSAIFVGDQIFAEADGSLLEHARVRPNAWVPYWVSLHNNFLMVGAFDAPGKNVFLSAYLPLDTSKIDRVGFSCHEGKISCANPQFGPAIVPSTDSVPYDTSIQSNLRVLGDPRMVAWYSWPLRVKNEGMVAFDIEAEHTVTVVLSTKEQDQSYNVVLGADNNTQAYIYKNGKKVYSVKLTEAGFGKILSDRANTFWLSISGGMILVGAGVPGSDPFIVWNDDDYIESIELIGFRGSDHVQNVKTIAMLPPVKFGVKQREMSYARPAGQISYTGTIKMLYAFDFEVLQNEQQLTLKDKLTGKDYPVIKTPTEEREFPFRLDIKPDGTPLFTATAEGKASEKEVKLKQEASIAEAVGQANLQAASAVALGGADMISGLSALAAGTAFSAAGIAAMTVSAKKRAELEARYRSPFSYVYIEQYARDAGIELRPDSSAQTEEMLIVQFVAQASQINIDQPNPDNPEANFSDVVQKYQNIINSVNSVASIRDRTTREMIFSTLESLIDAYNRNKDVYSYGVKAKLLAVLSDFYTNSYILDVNNRADAARRMSWYSAMVRLGEELLFNSDKTDVPIKKMYGEYVWYPAPLPQQDRGFIVFEANAVSDLFIGFSQQPISMLSEDDNQMYEVVLGARDNQFHEIRIKHMGSPAASLEKSKNKDGMLKSNQFERYWISLYDGVIKVGKGDPGKNLLLQWKDPFPWTGIQRVGISSWDVGLKIRNFKVGGFKPTGDQSGGQQASSAPASSGTVSGAAQNSTASGAVRVPTVQQPAALPTVNLAKQGTKNIPSTSLSSLTGIPSGLLPSVK